MQNTDKKQEAAWIAVDLEAVRRKLQDPYRHREAHAAVVRDRDAVARRDAEIFGDPYETRKGETP